MRFTRPASREPAASESGAPAATAVPLHAVSGAEYTDWDAVYRDNVARVYRLMFSKVGNRPDAEDLTTEVFLAALRPLRLPAPAPAVRGYLLAACRTALARHWARTFGEQVTSLPEDVEAVFTGTALESGAEGHAGQILAALPERYRRILQLRFLDGCSVAEAARALGITVGTAKVLQHRALRRAAEVAAEVAAEIAGELSAESAARVTAEAASEPAQEAPEAASEAES